LIKNTEEKKKERLQTKHKQEKSKETERRDSRSYGLDESGAGSAVTAVDPLPSPPDDCKVRCGKLAAADTGVGRFGDASTFDESVDDASAVRLDDGRESGGAGPADCGANEADDDAAAE
jgi:hypothetical protein